MHSALCSLLNLTSVWFFVYCGRRTDLEAKMFKGKYEANQANLEFPEGWGG